jgi:hypothetical protein
VATEMKTTGACRTCQSEQRHMVETCIARGASLPTICEKVNALIGTDTSKHLNVSGLRRHKLRHMGTDLVESLKARSLGAILGKGVTLDELRTQESENWLAHVVAYRAELDLDINTARANGDLLAISSLCGRRNRLLETLGRWLGELGISTVVNNVSLHTSPDFLELRRCLMDALKPFPDARRAVAKAMGELGRRKPEGEIIDVVSTPVISEPVAEAAILIPAEAAALAPLEESRSLVTGRSFSDAVGAVPHVPAVRDSSPIRLEQYIDAETSPREGNSNASISRLSR